MEVKSVKEVENYWDQFSNCYLSMDQSPNVFYYTLINMLKLEKRDNILEIGAGGGFLYNHTMSRKKQTATYHATDLSEEMLRMLCQRNNMIYSTTEPMINQSLHLTVEKANGEDLHYKDGQFDCLIANLCLQITTDPVKMLNESCRVLKSGGVAGFTVWGEKDKSSFFTLMPPILAQFGVKQPNVRTNFHLNDRENLIKMLENAGFTNVICWNQFVPFVNINDEDFIALMNFPANASMIQQAGDKAPQVKEALLEKLRHHIQVLKQPLGLDGLLVIATKP